MRKLILTSLVLVLALLITTACAPAATPIFTPAPTSAPPTSALAATATRPPAPTAAPLATATRAVSASPTPPFVILPTTGPTAPAVPDWNAIVKEELDKLQIGQLLFNPPAGMTLGETDRVVARLSENLAENITADIQGRGVPQVEPIRVGTFMKVRLAGDKFDITALNNEEQIVAGDHFTEWAWDVTPNEPGEQTLHLTVSVIVKIPNVTEARKDYPVRDRKVLVQVGPTYAVARFLGDYWQWIVTALGVPALGWGWKVRSDRLKARPRG